MPAHLLPAYLSAQFLDAFLAAAVLYGLFSESIASFETVNGIARGTPGSIQTAMMFGEFYPNPGGGNLISVSYWNAFCAEAIGTFLLVLMIFSLTEGCNVGRPDDRLTPLFIGMTVAAIICILAPLTQAGLNPARDLAPRLFSRLAGWGSAAFPDKSYGFLTIYVLAPILGGSVASMLFVNFLEPMMDKKNGCACSDQQHH